MCLHFGRLNEGEQTGFDYLAGVASGFGVVARVPVYASQESLDGIEVYVCLTAVVESFVAFVVSGVDDCLAFLEELFSLGEVVDDVLEAFSDRERLNGLTESGHVGNALFCRVGGCEQAQQIEVNHRAYSEHFAFVHVVEREIRLILLLEILKDIVGISDSAVSLGPHIAEGRAQTLVVFVVVFGQFFHRGCSGAEVLCQHFGHTPYHVLAV